MILVKMFNIVGRDKDKFEEFVKFCTDRPEVAEEIHNAMQLGNRGRLRDVSTALERMLQVFELTYSCSQDIRDMDVLNELGPETHEELRNMTTGEAIRHMGNLAAAESDLDWYGIPLCNDEERFTPDTGNENAPRRRRRGGF
jgi:hypothetical protein